MKRHRGGKNVLRTRLTWHSHTTISRLLVLLKHEQSRCQKEGRSKETRQGKSRGERKSRLRQGEALYQVQEEKAVGLAKTNGTKEKGSGRGGMYYKKKICEREKLAASFTEKKKTHKRQ